MMLARPISRRSTYVTLLVATLTFVAVGVAGDDARGGHRSAIAGVLDELAVDRLPLLWLNGFLLFAALAAIGLAASVSFDRLTPALGITAGIVVVMYFLEVLGTFWPDAEFLQPYSLFHYYQPKEILEGTAPVINFVLPGAVAVVAIGVGAVRVPAAGPGRAGLTLQPAPSVPRRRAK